MPPVLSTNTATPRACAASAMPRRSGSRSEGLGIDSTKTARVRSSISASNCSGVASGPVKRTVMPSRGSVTRKRLAVPP